MSEEKKQQLAVKVEADVLEQFNTMSELLVKTGAVKTKGDAVKYLLEQVNLKRLLEDNEWQEELQAMTHYADMLVNLFQSVITKTKTQRDVLRESKDKEIQDLQGQINELQAFTKSFEDELKQRDQIIGNQTSEIVQLQEQLQAHAAEYEQLQQQYKSVHTLFEEANENRKQVLAEKERHIETLGKQLAEQAQAITNMEAAYKALQEQGQEEREIMQGKLHALEEKAEQQRQAYETRIEAVRSENEASRAALRDELEQKYEARLNEAQRALHELTAQAAKADTLRQLAEEQLAAAQAKKATQRKGNSKKAGLEQEQQE